ncbi:MAG: DAK2 domain-containing protein [Oscillospiraceae bacterium]|nr:DAK2 domain-containing protein [Oscillospiraceae bacterium]
MIEGASAAIAVEKQMLNDLNVFPVPDGDTGTNMNLTMAAGAAEMRKKRPDTVGKAAETASGALLRGARGNSGVILSLLFRGISKGLKEKDEATSAEFAQAMVEGVDAAYKAVMKPAEGTMLTVSRVASAAAVEIAAQEEDVELTLEHAIKVGYEALAETINQNPVLQKAGVVDSGGKGYMIILEGMLRALRGEVIEAPAEEESRDKADFSAFATEEITFLYCTEFIIERENKKDPLALRGFLANIGDSLVVVDDVEIIKVHVHTDDPGRALTEALTYGSLLTIKIENMREQHSETTQAQAERAEVAGGEEKPQVAQPEKELGVVVVSAGEGMAAVFADLGADGIITGGQTMNPSTDDIVRAIDQVPAEIVYVLPNNKNIILAAQQAVPLSQKKVVIIPAKTVPQGVSALLNMDPDLGEAENTAAMEEAITRVKTVQITYASRDSDFDGQPIRAGQYLALLENKLLGSDDNFDLLLERVLGVVSVDAPEFVTVFYGEDVDEVAAEACVAAISEKFPNAEAAAIYGGQPVYYYMISFE